MKFELSSVPRREFVVAGCKGKHGYDTWNQARQIAGRMKVPGKPYRCEFCGKYHVGHHTKRKSSVKAIEP